jgi:hypothetical protein
MLVFYVKIWMMFFMFAMVKAIVPRYRYDQLMRLGWKIFLPTSLVAVTSSLADARIGSHLAVTSRSSRRRPRATLGTCSRWRLRRPAHRFVPANHVAASCVGSKPRRAL